MLRALVLLCVLVPCAAAQPERYELGQRLKAFEKAWEKHREDPTARKRALAILPEVTQQFFSLQLGEAGRTLDRARWALESDKEPSDATKWLTSLYAVPEKRLYDAETSEIKVTIKHFYKPPTPIPEGARVRLGFAGNEDIDIAIIKPPFSIKVPFRFSRRYTPMDGDRHLAIDFKADGAKLVHNEVIISFVPSFEKEFKKLVESRDKLKIEDGLVAATLLDIAIRVEAANDGEVGDTDFYASGNMSAARVLHFTNYDRQLKPNITWTLLESTSANLDYLCVPVSDKKAIPIRISTPKDRISTLVSPVPLVIALHGAGGSENMFIEGYGDGRIVKECAKRGWMLVCPRSPLAFGSSPPIKAIIEGLKKDFPFDESNVFILGHSMGAMQTIAACQENPGLFRAAAALGGGGRVTDAKAFADLPVFIGVGDKDFALSGAKALNKALKDGGAKNVTYKEYPDLEHLIIVRESLPDVFKMFDEVLKKDK